jgi:hypothetical protein
VALGNTCRAEASAEDALVEKPVQRPRVSRQLVAQFLLLACIACTHRHCNLQCQHVTTLPTVVPGDRSTVTTVPTVSPTTSLSTVYSDSPATPMRSTSRGKATTRWLNALRGHKDGLRLMGQLQDLTQCGIYIALPGALHA